MSNSLKIDFVSDVSCPWCVIGLKSLEKALARLGGELEADIHCQPFELNPQMSAEGEDVAEHIARKYGSGAAQIAQTQEAIRSRGAELGFEFRFGAALADLQHLRCTPPAALGRGHRQAAGVEGGPVQGLFHRRPRPERP